MVNSTDLAISALEQFNFPNTYCFSKCVAEHVLRMNKKVETIVIRPSVIGPSWTSPSPGWAGDKASTLVAGALLYLKSRMSVWYLPENRVPVVPVDVVSQYSISAAFNEDAPVALPPPSSPTSSPTSSSSSSSSFLSFFASPSKLKPSPNPNPKFKIITTCFNPSSHKNSTFTWSQFSMATIQLGAMKSYYSRFVGFLTHSLLTTMITKKVRSNNNDFRLFMVLHKIFARLPFELSVKVVSVFGGKEAGSKLAKVSCVELRRVASSCVSQVKIE